MLGSEGWRKWPLRIAVLDEEVAQIWVKVGKKKGIQDVQWSIIGEELTEEDIEAEGI